jgi:hypothetical protein
VRCTRGGGGLTGRGRGLTTDAAVNRPGVTTADRDCQE